MNDEDKKLMEQYHITCKPKMIYSYKGHKYDDLDAAVKYAQIDIERTSEDETAGK